MCVVRCIYYVHVIRPISGNVYSALPPSNKLNLYVLLIIIKLYKFLIIVVTYYHHLNWRIDSEIIVNGWNSRWKLSCHSGKKSIGLAWLLLIIINDIVNSIHYKMYSLMLKILVFSLKNYEEFILFFMMFHKIVIRLAIIYSQSHQVIMLSGKIDFWNCFTIVVHKLTMWSASV